jgi:hypothetical protein
MLCQGSEWPDLQSDGVTLLPTRSVAESVRRLAARLNFPSKQLSFAQNLKTTGLELFFPFFPPSPTLPPQSS